MLQLLGLFALQTCNLARECACDGWSHSLHAFGGASKAPLTSRWLANRVCWMLCACCSSLCSRSWLSRSCSRSRCKSCASAAFSVLNCSRSSFNLRSLAFPWRRVRLVCVPHEKCVRDGRQGSKWSVWVVTCAFRVSGTREACWTRKGRTQLGDLRDRRRPCTVLQEGIAEERCTSGFANTAESSLPFLQRERNGNALLPQLVAPGKKKTLSKQNDAH